MKVDGADVAALLAAMRTPAWAKKTRMTGVMRKQKRAAAEKDARKLAVQKVIKLIDELD